MWKFHVFEISPEVQSECVHAEKTFVQDTQSENVTECRKFTSTIRHATLPQFVEFRVFLVFFSLGYAWH